MDDTTSKKLFCLELVKTPDNAYAAALRVGLFNTSQALWIHENWQNDPFIVEEFSKLKAESKGIGEVWTKEEYLAYLRKCISDCWEDRDRFTGLKLYADVAGFMPTSGGNNVSVNVGIVNKVMRVPAPISEDEWEKKAVLQQARLVEHASS